MKPRNIHPLCQRGSLLAMGFLATALLLSSCAKESEKPTPQPSLTVPSDKATEVATAPLTGKAPSTGEESPTAGQRYFPESNKATARSAGGNTDYVDFDDYMGLLILPGYAANTFALAPFYIQQVGTAWVHVKENNEPTYSAGFRSNYGHYHLGYQYFEPCFLPGGTFGKPSGSSCLAMSPEREPRSLATHYGNEWIKIYAYDYTHPSRVFDLLSIRVTSGPIQLWFKKQGGGWYYWSSLGVGNWNLSAYTTGISEVLISGTGSLSIGFDDVQIRVPY